MAKQITAREGVSVPTEAKGVRIDEIATRRRRLDFSSLAFYLPDPDPVLRKERQDASVYRDLTVDAHVWACIQSRKAGVLSLNWEVEEGGPRSDSISAMLHGVNLRGMIGAVLDSVFWGFQPIEVIWELQGGLVVPARVEQKPPEWFVFGQANELRFLSAESGLVGEELPPMKFLLPRNQATYQNPYGERVLSRCFWPIAFKKGGWKFWATMAEKYGMPWAIGKYQRSSRDEDVSLFADRIERMVQDGIAVIRDDQDISFLETKSSGSGAIYRDIIRQADSEISKAILGHGGAADSTPGRLGGDDASMAVRQDIVDDDKALVEDAVNTLIRWLCVANWAGVEPPRFSMFREEGIDKTQAERDEILYRSGARFSKSYFMRSYGLDETDVEIATDAAIPPQFAEGPQRPPATRSPYTMEYVEKAASNATMRAAAELQRMVEQALAVVEDIPDDASQAEIDARIYSAYPKMQADAIVEMLSKATFAAHAAGRASAQEKTDGVR